jgi:hypothetical protein
VYVLDDATPLVDLPAAGGQDLHLFPVRAATAWRLENHKGDTGHKIFLAPNPPEGALLTYWLGPAALPAVPPADMGAKPAGKPEVKVTVTDAAGALVRELKGPAEAGLNRASWDLRLEAPVKPEEGAERSFMGPPRGPWVLPGSYTVKVAFAGKEASQTVVVEDDPRITATDAERRAWHDALQEAGRTWAKADAADKAAKSLKKQLEELKASFEKKKDTPEAVTKGVQALLDKVEPLAKRMTLDTPMGFAGAPLADDPEPLLPRARSLGFGLSGFVAPPTDQQRAVMTRTARDVDEVAAALRAIQQTDVPALNTLIYESGIGKIDAGKVLP